MEPSHPGRANKSDTVNGALRSYGNGWVTLAAGAQELPLDIASLGYGSERSRQHSPPEEVTMAARQPLAISLKFNADADIFNDLLGSSFGQVSMA